MQRVRAGLTGLAAIFLLVLVAATGIKPHSSAASPRSQGETLAVLGVAPGSSAEANRRDVSRDTPQAPAVQRRPTTI